jgi:MFS family permease
MTLLFRPALGKMSTADMRVIGVISFVHFISHFNLMVLPALFGVIREDLGVSYTELGLALVAFNIVSGVLQIPVGFLVDRIGARVVLIGGLLIEAIAFTTIGLVPSFYVFVAMHALAGIGNTAFHPADYAFLSKRVSHRNIGFAFSFHTFAGMMGMAAGPAATFAFYASFGWRSAFIGMMALSWIAIIVLLFEREHAEDHEPAAPLTAKSLAPSHTGLRLLLSAPILLNFVFFLLAAFSSYGVANYLVAALQALHGTSLELANTTLTLFLLMTAVGVIAAGAYVDRLRRHALLAATGMIVFAIGAVAIGLIDLSAFALAATVSVIGFASGIIYPSRDMLVREVTPPGEFGKVFGFVTSAFNLAGILAPFAYGGLMDRGSPAAVFIVVGLGSALTVLTLGWSRRASRPTGSISVRETA